MAGARQAHDSSSRWDWSNHRRARLREAITLHLNVTVPPRQGAEAHLLHAGAAADVVGARERLRIEAQLRPDGRTAFPAGHGFFAMIGRAPFED